MNTKEIKNELKTIVHAFADNYKSAAQRSWEEQVKRLGPGTTSPQLGRFFTVEERGKFDDFAAGQREKLRRAVSGVSAEIDKMRTEAPSSEAVNAITMLGMRSSISEDELYAAADRYGSNYMAYKAIRDIGAKNKIFIPEKHAADRMADGLSSVDRIAADMITSTAENGRWSAGYLAMVDMTIDDAFPD